MICGSGGLKSRLAKAAGTEPSSQMRDEKLHAVAPRSLFGSEKAKLRKVSRCTHVKNDTHKSKSVTFREPLDLDMHMTRRHEC